MKYWRPWLASFTVLFAGADPSEVGSFVEDQTLCIIEAMKLMNEIESEYRSKLWRFWWKTGSRWSWPALVPD